MKTPHLIWILVLFFGLWACKKEPLEHPETKTGTMVVAQSEDSSASPSPQPISENRSSLFWKVSGGDLEKPSYLFGTIHLIPEPQLGFIPTLDSLLLLSDRLVLEANPRDPAIQAASSKHAVLDPSLIQDMYTPAEMAMLSHFCDSIGLDFNQLVRYQPLVIAQLITTRVLGAAYPLTSYEDELIQLAEKRGVILDGAEGPDYVYSYLSKLDALEQADNLVLLTETAKQDPRLGYDEMLDTYLRQDIEGLYNLVKTGMGSSPENINILVSERNEYWLSHGLIDQHESRFIAVGSGHLYGERGLIQLLKKKGYKVESIQVSK
ncbi:TraB/GumN family protein [bacterium SCSIO 12741]|nr:TraB/GumN family protein [bacterium SCSIO 12741]